VGDDDDDDDEADGVEADTPVAASEALILSYIAVIGAAKYALVSLRFNLSVGVRQPFSTENGSPTNVTALGNSYDCKPSVVVSTQQTR